MRGAGPAKKGEGVRVELVLVFLFVLGGSLLGLKVDAPPPR